MVLLKYNISFYSGVYVALYQSGIKRIKVKMKVTKVKRNTKSRTGILKNILHYHAIVDQEIGL